MLIDRNANNIVLLTQKTVVFNGSMVPFYGSLEGADNYFSMMLEGQRWIYTDHLRRTQALISATKRIDRLNFVGDVTDESQPLQFPRGTDTVVPVDIEHANYELALVLLKGVDPDTEQDNLNTIVQAFGGIRSEYDRSSIPSHLRAGIPSATAWNLLLPYLKERREIEIRRDS